MEKPKVKKRTGAKKGQKYNVNPTRNQKAVFQKVQEQIANGEIVSLARAQREVGYSEHTIRKSTNLKNSVGWNMLIEQLPDEPFLRQLKEIALGEGKDADKIKAIQEIFKLKDRYPKGKLATTVYEQEIKELS